MPKRNNPFGDHSSLQLKTHIGTKEVDKGVDQITRMQSVYDKTHELLFSGMKDFTSQKQTNNNNNEKNFNCFESQSFSGTPSVRKDNFKQMHLGNSCQLVEDVEMETCENSSDNVQGGMVKWSPGDCNKADFTFGRTPCEYSPPGFVSATSLLITPPHSSAIGTGKNVFERMRNAQMNLSSKSKSVGGACHGCTKPVHAKEVMKCQFCENYVCSVCTRQCSGCFQHFCQLCSVLNYNEVRVRAFCFACNGR